MDEIQSLEAEIAEKEEALAKARAAKLKALEAEEKKQAKVVERTVKKAEAEAAKLKKARDAVKGSPTAAQAQKIAGARVLSDEASNEKREAKQAHRTIKNEVSELKAEIRVAERAKKASDAVFEKERKKAAIKAAKAEGIDASKPGRKPRKKKIRMVYVPVVPSKEALKH